jgi:hypothetical protein
MVNLRLDDESGDHHLGPAAIRCDIGINTQDCHGTFLIFKKGQINVDGVFWLDREKAALSRLGSRSLLPAPLKSYLPLPL